MPLDLVNNSTQTVTLTSGARTTDANGSTVDLMGYKSALFVADVGANGSIATDSLSSSISLQLEIEESADDSDWSDVDSADIIFDGTEPVGTNDGCFALIADDTSTSSTYKAQYVGDKRYVRCVANFTSTPSIPLSVMVHALEPTYAPV